TLLALLGEATSVALSSNNSTSATEVASPSYASLWLADVRLEAAQRAEALLLLRVEHVSHIDPAARECDHEAVIAVTANRGDPAFAGEDLPTVSSLEADVEVGLV